jgi:hypothetical protein
LRLQVHKEILKKLDHLERREIEQDEKIMLIFEYLKQLEQVRQQEIDQRNRKRVCFKRMDEHFDDIHPDFAL